MSGGIVYAATRADVRGAITLLSALASNPVDTLWCGAGKRPATRPGPCGHSDDWYCAAEALGISSDAVALAIASAVRVTQAWIHLDDRVEESLYICAPAHVSALFSEDGEAECLLREGWLPRDWRLVRRHQDRCGEYIALYWEAGEPATYYVRGHVDEAALHLEIRRWFDGSQRAKVFGPIRHGHAYYAFNGQNDDGNAKRVLRECDGRRRGCFAITAMDRVKDDGCR